MNPFELENTFDTHTAIEWAREHADVPIFAICVYLTIIFYVPDLMKNREPWNLRKVDTLTTTETPINFSVLILRVTYFELPGLVVVELGTFHILHLWSQPHPSSSRAPHIRARISLYCLP
jgi:hypothetical protein